MFTATVLMLKTKAKTSFRLLFGVIPADIRLLIISVNINKFNPPLCHLILLSDKKRGDPRNLSQVG
jgi:hypothetical protein